MRFGVVVDTDDEARTALLERNADRIRELLEQLDGCVQMSVKAYYDENSLLREVLRKRPDLKRRADELEGRPVEESQGERIALGQEVSQAVDEQREADQQLLVEPLARAAVDVRVEPAAGERMALNAQLLVRRDRRAELDQAVQRLADTHGDRFAIRYVGPLAPYSFSDVSLEPPEDAWD